MVDLSVCAALTECLIRHVGTSESSASMKHQTQFIEKNIQIVSMFKIIFEHNEILKQSKCIFLLILHQNEHTKQINTLLC